MARPTLYSQTSTTWSTETSSFTHSFNVPANLQNSALVVIVMGLDSQSTTAISPAVKWPDTTGTTLTRNTYDTRTSTSRYYCVSIHTIVNPSATNSSISVTLGVSTVAGAMWAGLFQHVDQTTPVPTTAKATNNLNSTSATASLTAAFDADALLIAAWSIRDGTLTHTISGATGTYYSDSSGTDETVDMVGTVAYENISAATNYAITNSWDHTEFGTWGAIELTGAGATYSGNSTASAAVTTTSTPKKQILLAATLSASAAVSAVGDKTTLQTVHTASASLTAPISLTPVSNRITVTASAAEGPISLTAAASKTTPAAGSAAGATTLSAEPATTAVAAGQLAAALALTDNSAITAQANLAAASDATTEAHTQSIKQAQSTLEATLSTAQAAYKQTQSTAEPTASTTIAADAQITGSSNAQATLTATAGAAPEATITVAAAAAPTIAPTLEAGPSYTTPAAATLTVESFTTTATLIYAAATLSSITPAALSATPSTITATGAALASDAAVQPTHQLYRRAAASGAAQAALAAILSQRFDGLANLAAPGALAALAEPQLAGAASLDISLICYAETQSGETLEAAATIQTETLNHSEPQLLAFTQHALLINNDTHADALATKQPVLTLALSTDLAASATAAIHAAQQQPVQTLLIPSGKSRHPAHAIIAPSLALAPSARNVRLKPGRAIAYASGVLVAKPTTKNITNPKRIYQPQPEPRLYLAPPQPRLHRPEPPQ